MSRLLSVACSQRGEVLMSPERAEMLRLITSAVVPVTRPAGFRKSGQMFHRRRCLMTRLDRASGESTAN